MGVFFRILVQAIGFGAMALGIFSYQAKTRKTILIMQGGASFLWGIHFLFLGQLTGTAQNAVGVLRNVLYAQKDKHKWAKSKLLPAGIMLLFLVAGIITYNGFLSIFPTLAMLLSSISLYLSDERKIRILSIFVSLSWLVFDISSNSIPGVCSEVFTLCSIGIAIYRFKKKPE